MRVKIALATTAAAALLSTPAHAKDLRNRIGAGFDAQIGELPALSIKYTFPASDKAINMALEGIAGVRIPADGEPGVLAGGRFLYTVVAEDQMNFYLGAGGFYRSVDSETEAFNGMRIQGVVGSELFLYGLDNLGISLDLGINVDLGGPVPGVGTTAGAGVRYYF